MLDLQQIGVAVGETDILHNLSLKVDAGEVHVLLGPNGSGKSTVLSAIMGLAPYRLTDGSMCFRGEPLDELDVHQRAELGLGLAFQRPPSLEGVTVAQFASALGADDRLERGAKLLDMEAFLDRDVVVGFSGGEIKRWEILKLFLQQPDFLLFDEPESGVDLQHIAAVGEAIQELVDEPAKDGSKRGALLITHTGLILEYINADVAHIMNAGAIVHTGPPKELFSHIQKEGYVAPR
ncbi:MAG: ATP-binding cassette domain-containing protein [Pseudomonadota bacterium]